MNSNEVQTFLLNGLIIVVVILNITYIHFNIKLKRKIKEAGADKTYIKHLENMLKECERITIRQNILLKNDNSTNGSTGK